MKLIGEPLGLVIVDSSIASDYISVRRDSSNELSQDEYQTHLASKLFLGGYEDFLDSPSIFTELETPLGAPSRLGLLEDLIYYWQRKLPSSFDPVNPALLSLSCYPLRIIAAEWTNYMASMNYHIKRYEYSVESLSTVAEGLDRLNIDLQSLQGWRRRSLASKQKIGAIQRFVSSQHQQRDLKDEALTDDASLLSEDFAALADSLEEYSRRLENMLPVVTSLVQISDSRQSFAEAANIGRLTTLAFLFVPLSFTSSLFSMNSLNAPGGRYFWVYFIVAIPLTLMVFVLARPPSRIFRWLRDRVRPVRMVPPPV